MLNDRARSDVLLETLDLAEIRSTLDRYGWAVARGSVLEVEAAIARASGLRRASLRPGESTRALRPHAMSEAPPRSLSALTGLDEQPLHSDGAHLPDPPDVIVLHSVTETATATVVWALPRLSADHPYVAEPPVHVRNGVFTVRAKAGSFLASAFSDGRLRFDPGCMSPSDGYAKKAVEEFRDRRAEAHTHEWTEPNMLLFIDNRTALHARDAVVDADTRELTRLAYSYEATS